MNDRIKELSSQARDYAREYVADCKQYGYYMEHNEYDLQFEAKFAELIVKEMCGMMEQAEDDCYHCFEPSERPTEYISWLNEWRTRFEQHFGVEE
jgi:hypothetical protein